MMRVVTITSDILTDPDTSSMFALMPMPTANPSLSKRSLKDSAGDKPTLLCIPPELRNRIVSAKRIGLS